MQARKILLFNEGIPWVKNKKNEDFDVPMNCFDGAEVCELVGSCIIQQVNQILNITQLGYVDIMVYQVQKVKE